MSNDEIEKKLINSVLNDINQVFYKKQMLLTTNNVLPIKIYTSYSITSEYIKYFNTTISSILLKQLFFTIQNSFYNKSHKDQSIHFFEENEIHKELLNLDKNLFLFVDEYPIINNNFINNMFGTDKMLSMKDLKINLDVREIKFFIFNDFKIRIELSNVLSSVDPNFLLKKQLIFDVFLEYDLAKTYVIINDDVLNTLEYKLWRRNKTINSILDGI